MLLFEAFPLHFFEDTRHLVDDLTAPSPQPYMEAYCLRGWWGQLIRQSVDSPLKIRSENTSIRKSLAINGK